MRKKRKGPHEQGMKKEKGEAPAAAERGPRERERETIERREYDRDRQTIDRRREDRRHYLYPYDDETENGKEYLSLRGSYRRYDDTRKIYVSRQQNSLYGQTSRGSLPKKHTHNLGTGATIRDNGVNFC